MNFCIVLLYFLQKIPSCIFYHIVVHFVNICKCNVEVWLMKIFATLYFAIFDKAILCSCHQVIGLALLWSSVLAIVHDSSFHYLSHYMDSIVLSFTQPRRCKYKIWAQLPISMDNGHGLSIHFITGQFDQFYFPKLLFWLHHCNGQEMVLYIYKGFTNLQRKM